MKTRRIPRNNPTILAFAILLAATLPGLANADNHKNEGAKSAALHRSHDDHGTDRLRIHDREHEHERERGHECDDDRRHCPVSP